MLPCPASPYGTKKAGMGKPACRRKDACGHNG